MSKAKKYKPHDGTITGHIDDGKFEISYINYDENDYDRQLQQRVRDTCDLFQDYPSQIKLNIIVNYCDLDSEVNVVPSPKSHYRNRSRFGIMKIDGKLSYNMWEAGVPSLKVSNFPIAILPISNTMKPLLEYLENNNSVHSFELLSELKSVHFLSTLDGQLIITLCYERNLSKEIWREEGFLLRNHLLSLQISSVSDINIIGRCRGVKLIVGRDTVTETLSLVDGRVLKYFTVEDGFSNPNAIVNSGVLSWVCDSIKIINQSFVFAKREAESCNDEAKETETKIRNKINILELFCGNGNHTMAMAEFANIIVAVELNKSLCVTANENLKLNNIDNVEIVPCDSQKFAYRVIKNKSYKNIQFDMILVDPPRGGLDANTKKLIQLYDFIIYISCNPISLKNDIEHLKETHEIVKFGVFDQFAYTLHTECGVLLKKTNN